MIHQRVVPRGSPIYATRIKMMNTTRRAAWALLLTACCGQAAGGLIVRCHNHYIVVDDLPDEDFMYGECTADDGAVFHLLNRVDEYSPGSSPLLEVEEVGVGGHEAVDVKLAAYLRDAFPHTMQYFVLRTVESEALPTRRQRVGAQSATMNVLTLVLVYSDGSGLDNTPDDLACDEGCWADATFDVTNHSVHTAFQDGSYGRISFDRASSKRMLVAMDGAVASREGCQPQDERVAALGRSGENEYDYNLIECARKPPLRQHHHTSIVRLLPLA